MTLKNNLNTYLILLAACLTIIPCKLAAQDFNYSLYQYTTLNINPALLSTEKDVKITLHYHQNDLGKGLNLKNTMLSLMLPINLTKNVKLPQGIGISMANDNTGKQGLVNRTAISLSLAQGVTINRWSALSAGFQASYLMYSNTNPGNYITGSQWVDGTGFDPSQGINEQLNYENINLFTISTGFNWNIFSGATSKGNFGVAMYHVNKPKFSFLNDDNAIKPRYVLHGDYTLVHLKAFTITPRFLLVQQNSRFISGGVVVNYQFKADNPFLAIKKCVLGFGVDYRNDRSGIVHASMEQQRYIVGISYGVALKPSQFYSTYGANFEVSVAFKFSHSKNKTPDNEYVIGETRLIFDKGIHKQKISETTEGADQPQALNRTDSLYITGEKYKVQLRQDFKFNFNEAVLNENAKAYLDELARMLKQNPNLKVEVIGHTDDVGSDADNQKISGLRAKVTMGYLVSKGINANRLKLTAKGKSEPVAPNNTEENRTKNRRVEFVVYSE